MQQMNINNLSIKLTLHLCYVKCMLLALTPSELDGTKENHQGITGMFQLLKAILLLPDSKWKFYFLKFYFN